MLTCMCDDAGLQYLLPATWTAVKEVGVDLVRLSQLLSRNPARLAGLSDTKGSIAKGKDADFVVSLCATCGSMGSVVCGPTCVCTHCNPQATACSCFEGKCELRMSHWG